MSSPPPPADRRHAPPSTASSISARASASISASSSPVTSSRAVSARDHLVEAVPGGPDLLDLARPAVQLRVAFLVTVVAVDLALEQRWAAARSGSRDRLPGRLVDGEEVVPVDHDAGQPEAVGPLGDVWLTEVVHGGRGLRVAVVLDDEDARQVPHRGEVQALEERALVRAAVAHEGDSDLLRAADLGRQADTADHGRAPADDPVRAEHPAVDVGDVHRPALAAAEPVRAAVDLEHHRLHVAALRDRVSVAAMGAGDVVVVVQVRADAGRDRLLARVEVDESRDVAGCELDVQPLLELADRAHGPVGGDEPFLRDRFHRLLLGRFRVSLRRRRRVRVSGTRLLPRHGGAYDARVARHRIALLPGDGVGVEVTDEARKVVDALGLDLEWTLLDWGSDHWQRTGSMMPPDWEDVLRAHDACLMGACGRPDVPDHVSLWGLILLIRQTLDLWANVRRRGCSRASPARWPADGPQDVDMLFVRENTEGEYAGVGGRSHRGHAQEVGIETSVFTRFGVERVVRHAFELAEQRRGLLTSATKSNASRYGYVLWDEVCETVAAEHPDVRYERVLVDALAARMVRSPDSLDVVVASNLFADILTDLAAAIQGGMGMAASANVAPGARRAGPVRARARVGARHRRPGHRQPVRRRLEHGADARAPGGGRGRGTRHARARGRLPRRPANPRHRRQAGPDAREVAASAGSPAG